MNIDFDGIELKSLPNFKGGEKEFNVRMFVDDRHKIMKGSLEPGASIGTHTHDDSDEIMFITAGGGYVECDGERLPVAAGSVHYCPAGHSHTLVNDGTSPLSFHAVVTLF